MNKSLFNENSNIISAKLAEYRKKHGLSQEELAARMQLLGIDITQPLISKIERNQRFVKDYELAAICHILNLSEKELLSDFYDQYSD